MKLSTLKLKSIKSSRYLFSFVALVAMFNLNAKLDEDYYFNQKLEFADKVVKPEEVLGYPVGKWHLRPDQSVTYFKTLADSSSKVLLKQIGRTHEERPLITAYISSEENLAQLEQIKQQRQNLKDYQGPNIVWLGYSVHGNEASGANAALMVAYRLAASKEAWVKELLANTIVMIDPMLNPDGMARFAHWVNSYKGRNLVADSDSVEHNEAWPSGRMNHYWFDLNRDWLLLQHPESQARVKHFYDWRPHIVGDFHEMGTNSSYFFQPGVPSRQNPLTPQTNFDLTNEIAKFHAKELDDLGSSYYSKESFDDFYYGKGSTFPDINGGIGILYEQASARGHLQESINGDLSFPFAIRNHIATSFSTLKAALEKHKELSQYQRDFFKGVGGKISQDKNKAVIFTSSDNTRLAEALRLLQSHQIQVSQLAQSKSINKKPYSADKSYVINFNQQQYQLVKALFETRTQFKDNTFYDVSAWTLPLALNLQYQYLDKGDLNALSLKSISKPQTTNHIAANSVAILVPWDDLKAAKGLNKLLAQGIKVKFANKPFTSSIAGKEKSFAAGTLLIHTRQQTLKSADLIAKVSQLFDSLNIPIYGADSGFSLSGVDLGSPSMASIEPVKPLLLIGSGVSPYEAGEIWHLLDKRLGMAVSMQAGKDLANIDLDKYSHLILVNGRYPKLKDEQVKILKSWISAGGNLIASRRAVAWVVENKLADFAQMQKDKADKESKKAEQYKFSQRDDIHAHGFIGGAIYKTLIDNSHPLAYGMDLNYVPVTKSGTQVLKPATEDFVTVASYADKPLMAGYSSQENQNKIKNSPAILAKAYGRGSIVLFNDNPVFRGYWLGSARAFINSLYFNQAL